MKKNIIISLVLVALFISEIVFGSVDIHLGELWSILLGDPQVQPSSRIIVFESRFPRALTAAIGGSGLALSGLLMQTLFRNPLAGPSVLGISSGASLGVALLVLTTSGVLSGMSQVALTAAAAMAGAFSVLLLVMAVARRLSDNTALLIFGIMLSFFTGAIVDALQFKSSNDSLRAYVNWGMGSFAESGMTEILMMSGAIAISMMIAFFILNRLNILLLGFEYAQSMGVNTRSTRFLMILATGIPAGIVTAFCGPVSFIGLAVPHLVRTILKTSNHTVIFIPVVLTGASVGLLCDLASRILSLPLNTIASALGAPVVVLILLQGNKSKAII